MMALFADLPEALANTVEIARRCAFRPKMRSPILPQFASVHADSKEAVDAAETAELCRQAREGLDERLRVIGARRGHAPKRITARGSNSS